MMDEADIALLKLIGDALGQAQAMNRANQYILMEVVRDLARTQADSQKYLASLFERISGRADQGPVVKELHPVNAEFRLAISTFFSKAGLGL
jgi:hypothetical protein